MYGVVLSETLNYMKKSLQSSNVLKLFQLSELKKILCISYELYTGTSIELHSQRFKEDLLQNFPGLQAHKNGKQMILTQYSVSSDAITRSRADDGMCLVKQPKSYDRICLTKLKYLMEILIKKPRRFCSDKFDDVSSYDTRRN